MGNFKAYSGLWLKAEEDKGPHIKKGDTVQLMNVGIGLTPNVFTFVGIPGQYPKTGAGWTPVIGPPALDKK